MFSRAFTVAKQEDMVFTETGDYSILQAVRWNPHHKRFVMSTLVKSRQDFIYFRNFWAMTPGSWGLRRVSRINGVYSWNESKLCFYHTETWKKREDRRQEIMEAVLGPINIGYLQKVLEDANPSYTLSVEVKVDGFGQVTSNTVHKGNLHMNPATIGYIEGMESELRFVAADMVEQHKEQILRTLRHLGG